MIVYQGILTLINTKRITLEQVKKIKNHKAVSLSNELFGQQNAVIQATRYEQKPTILH